VRVVVLGQKGGKPAGVRVGFAGPSGSAVNKAMYVVRSESRYRDVASFAAATECNTEYIRHAGMGARGARTWTPGMRR
jgi:hypothetical protein